MPTPNTHPQRTKHLNGCACAPTLRHAGCALFCADLRILWRHRADAIQPALLALLVVVLFTLGNGAAARPSPEIASTVVWLAALVASLLSLDRLFAPDMASGILEQWLTSSIPLAWCVAIRVFTHWLVSGVPIVFLSPWLTRLLGGDLVPWPTLALSLCMGTALFSVLGAIIAALTLAMRGSSLLLALLVLPLYSPVLILGAGSVAIAAQGLDPSGPLLLLTSGLVIGLTLGPSVAALAIRIALT